MRTVTVHKDRLVEKLKENKADHLAIHKTAHDNWKREVEKALEKALDLAQRDVGYVTQFNLPEPQSYGDEYTRAIAMAEESVYVHIELTESEFRRYWLDEWDWQRGFTNTTSMYGIG